MHTGVYSSLGWESVVNRPWYYPVRVTGSSFIVAVVIVMCLLFWLQLTLFSGSVTGTVSTDAIPSTVTTTYLLTSHMIYNVQKTCKPYCRSYQWIV